MTESGSEIPTPSHEPQGERFEEGIGWIRPAYIQPERFTPDELREASESADEASKGYARATGGYALLSDGRIYEGFSGETYRSESINKWLRRSGS